MKRKQLGLDHAPGCPAHPAEAFAMIDEIFPAIERFGYQRSPLTQVVVQFNFPTILRIESAPPADFQESVRSSFPIFQRQSALFGGAQMPPEIARIFAGAPNGGAYLFASEDKTSTVALTPQSLTFTSSNYDRWETFKVKYLHPLAALVTVYKPSFFERVGLRYSNAIDRSALSTSEPWSCLLSPRLLGELSDPLLESGVVDARRVLQVTDPKTAESFILQHGLNVAGRPGAYAIDFDFIVLKRTEIDHAGHILDRLHGRASRAFRWAISDQLHELLGPVRLHDSIREYGT